MAKADLSAETLRTLLDYDRCTGKFTRKTGRYIGQLAGSVTNSRYIHIYVGSKSYSAHRLAWLYMLGEWPPGDIDHINGNGTDNRWQNLRTATESVNLQNQRRARSDNRSGLMGALKTPYGRWKSVINIGGMPTYLGTFRTPEEAHAAYLEAKRKHHEGCTI